MNDTVAVYDRMVDDYVALADDLPSTLPSFLKALKPGARVLDLGCGPGHHAEVIAGLGHDVLAVDASAEMIKHAGARKGVRVRQATFDDIPDLGEFDAVWASFALLHARRADVPRHIAQIKCICAPGAIFSLTLKVGEGEATDSLGRFYSYFSRAELESYLEEAGFTVGRVETGAVMGMAGHEEPWIGIEAHG